MSGNRSRRNNTGAAEAPPRGDRKNQSGSKPSPPRAGKARGRPSATIANALAAAAASGKAKAPAEATATTSVRLVKVEPDRDGQRLDNFLLGQLKGVPRSLIYRIVRSGEVRVDGGRCKPDQRLQGGQTVRIPPVRQASADAAIPASSHVLQSLQQRILFEDEDLLVLDKPSGLAAHGGSGVSYGAIEALRQLRPQANLELVHRLDRDTSGVMLLAKRRALLLELQRIMRQGSADKRYLTLLAGEPERERFDVNAPLRKQMLGGGERMVQVASDGKPSLSLFRVLERYAGCALVEVKIETGRTHQIRVHARHAGHPVAGDPKYGDDELNRRLRGLGLERLFLHAASMQLRLPGESQDRVWSAPLPEGLERVLVGLRAEG